MAPSGGERDGVLAAGVVWARRAPRWIVSRQRSDGDIGDVGGHRWVFPVAVRGWLSRPGIRPRDVGRCLLLGSPRRWPGHRFCGQSDRREGMALKAGVCRGNSRRPAGLRHRFVDEPRASRRALFVSEWRQPGTPTP